MSQKQTDANRRNAQRSTGPRSKEGKARSSGNALSHGLNQTFDAQSDPRFMQWVVLFIKDGLPEIEAKQSADRLLQYRRVMDTRLSYWQGVGTDHDELKMERELIEETIDTIGFANLTKRDKAFISKILVPKSKSSRYAQTPAVQRMVRLKPLDRYLQKAAAQLAKTLRAL